MRDFIATIVAMVVVILTGGNLPVAMVAWFAVFLMWPSHDVRVSAERRYRMRETERRNESLQRWRETRRLLNSRDLTKM